MAARQRKTQQSTTQKRTTTASKAKQAEDQVEVEETVEAGAEAQPEGASTVEDTTATSDGAQDGGAGGDADQDPAAESGRADPDPLLSRFVTGEAQPQETPAEETPTDTPVEETTDVSVDAGDLVEAQVVSDVYTRTGASARKGDMITVTGEQLARGVRAGILRAV
ncbi:hypothetical protein [Nesterenkonia suensis]